MSSFTQKDAATTSVVVSIVLAIARFSQSHNLKLNKCECAYMIFVRTMNKIKVENVFNFFILDRFFTIVLLLLNLSFCSVIQNDIMFKNQVN